MSILKNEPNLAMYSAVCCCLYPKIFVDMCPDAVVVSLVVDMSPFAVMSPFVADMFPDAVVVLLVVALPFVNAVSC